MSTSVHAETTRTHTPPLDQKIAVIFGASGAGGAAVAREFAAQGATVFLSGRTLPTSSTWYPRFKILVAWPRPPK